MKLNLIFVQSYHIPGDIARIPFLNHYKILTFIFSELNRCVNKTLNNCELIVWNDFFLSFIFKKYLNQNWIILARTLAKKEKKLTRKFCMCNQGHLQQKFKKLSMFSYVCMKNSIVHIKNLKAPIMQIEVKLDTFIFFCLFEKKWNLTVLQILKWYLTTRWGHS